MKKTVRYMFVVLAAFVAIVFVLNLPKLGRDMLDTIKNITLNEWLIAIGGITIGSVAMAFAKKEKKEEVSEEESEGDFNLETE